jgi:amino acid permease
LLTAFYNVVFIVVSSISFMSNNPLPKFEPFVNVSSQFLIAFPIICFAYQCHIHVIPIYSELKNPSKLKMNLIIVSSMAICFLFYCSVGIFGYLNFGIYVKGNVILNFGLEVFPSIARVCISITAVFSYPIHSLTSRLAIESLFFKERMSIGMYVFITLSYVAITTVLSIYMPGIVSIFGLMGSIGACTLMFLFPAMLLFTRKSIIKKIFASILFIFGFVLGITGTVFTVLDIFKIKI